MANIVKLKPSIIEKIWGGKKLAQMKAIPEGKYDQIGETWEVSLLKDGPSYCEDSGKEISELLGSNSFQYLVKFIDASDDLSIQVHPDDEYAKKNENSLGKTECWFILDADPGCGIYLGLREGVDKKRLEHAILEKEDVSKLLNFVPVKEGDFFFVPAGTIHAIGKGVTLAEVQQSSGITYRVWDWNRVDNEGKSRELHVDKALDVINFKSDRNRLDSFKMEGEVKSDSLRTLIQHRDFNVDYYKFNKGEGSVEISRSREHRPSSILNLNSRFSLNDNIMNPYETVIMDGELDISIKTLEKDKLSDSVSFLYIY